VVVRQALSQPAATSTTTVVRVCTTVTREPADAAARACADSLRGYGTATPSARRPLNAVARRNGNQRSLIRVLRRNYRPNGRCSAAAGRWQNSSVVVCGACLYAAEMPAAQATTSPARR